MLGYSSKNTRVFDIPYRFNNSFFKILYDLVCFRSLWHHFYVHARGGKYSQKSIIHGVASKKPAVGSFIKHQIIELGYSMIVK